jgi:hypothetical protein
MRTATSLVLALGLSACTAGGDSQDVVLTDSLSDGKEDSVNGKSITVDILENAPAALPAAMTDVVRVPESNSDWILIEGKQYIARPAPDTTLDISVDKPFGETLTNYRFIMSYRAVGSEEWSPMEVSGTVESLFSDPREVTLNNFDSIQIDLEHERFSFEVSSLEGSIPFKGIRGEELEVAVFVFPYSGWGSLEGEYNYTLNLDGDDGIDDTPPDQPDEDDDGKKPMPGEHDSPHQFRGGEMTGHYSR